VAKSSLTLKQIPRQRLARVVAELLIRRIHEQHLAPDTKLPSERELMRQLRVGRSTVREALNGLALLNVVEIRHGQGAFVASQEQPQPEALDAALSRGVTTELLEVRLLVEVAMAGFAAERATPEDLASIEATLVAYEHVLQAGEESVHQGARFHLRLMEAGHNDVLLGLIRRYTTHLLEGEERGAALERRSQRHDEGFTKHRDLFEAIRSRDPAFARARMQAHLEQSAEEVV
jgi:GntR family transcriptional repressor for pyruvate dehydrogenase complex